MDLDFLDGGEPADNTPAPEAEGQARGPDGKFVAASEPAPEPVPEPVAAEPAPEPAPPPQPAPEPVQPGHVPITAMLEERDKRKALEERLRQYEAQQAQRQAPDPYEDPAGYEAYRDQAIEQRILNERLNFSERLARRDHGPETVEKAREWAIGRFQEDPLYYQRIMGQADPYDAVVQDYKREQVFANLKDNDLDAFLAWKSGQGSPSPHPIAAPLAAQPQFVAPPRSLASAPAAGSPKPGEHPVGPGVAFDGLFKG